MSKAFHSLAGLTSVLCLAAVSCGGAGAKQPGINLGAPMTAWAEKSREERMGYMAARVEPVMRQLFVEFDSSNDDFGCATCHSESMELVNFQVPTDDLFALPTENTIAEAKDFDEEVTQFMVDKVVPTMSKLFNTGRGPKVEVTCFTCHPADQ